MMTSWSTTTRLSPRRRKKTRSSTRATTTTNRSRRSDGSSPMIRDEEMAPAKASPSSVPVSSDKKETRPGTPTPFDARGFHDRYRKRSAPVSADKRESYDLVELTDQKAESHDSEKKSVLPAGCHTHDVDPKYALHDCAERCGRKDARRPPRLMPEPSRWTGTRSPSKN